MCEECWQLVTDSRRIRDVVAYAVASVGRHTAMPAIVLVKMRRWRKDSSNPYASTPTLSLAQNDKVRWKSDRYFSMVNGK